MPGSFKYPKAEVQFNGGIIKNYVLWPSCFAIEGRTQNEGESLVARSEMDVPAVLVVGTAHPFVGAALDGGLYASL